MLASAAADGASAASASAAAPAATAATIESSGKTPSSVWELDFYSRPVQGADGKKLWELLVTDESGSFQHVEAVPSNCINSRELRTRVQRLIARQSRHDLAVRPHLLFLKHAGTQ